MLVEILEVKLVSRKQLLINELESRINDINEVITEISSSSSPTVMIALQGIINAKIKLLVDLNNLKKQ